mmetsp:Transcript_58150/g.138395  ORF Transcript_58150/g.138395 Transcript_58150/m.138395 type:complete len:638 (-) Transcript_58150:142-2055(-)
MASQEESGADGACATSAELAEMPEKTNGKTSPTQGESGREEYADLLDDEEEVEAKEKQLESPPEPPVLEGDWQQLEGLPKELEPAVFPRFLSWTDFGHCALRPADQKLEVWHSSEDRPRHLVDRTGVDMMAMSSTAFCMASSTPGTAGSRIRIYPLQKWERASFEASLPGGLQEAVEAIACGDEFVAALTSQQMLRIFTLSGQPVSAVCLPGRGVAMAARGSMLLVVTGQTREPNNGEQERLEYQFLDVKTRAKLAMGLLPLSPHSRLRWLGLTAELAPISVDTAGVVRALLGLGHGSWGSAGCGGEWVPVLDLAAEEDRNGPLWAVYAKQGALYCARQNDEQEEPLPSILEEPEEALLEGMRRPRYGRGAALVEKTWCIPLGPIPAVSISMGEALAENMLARHARAMCDRGHMDLAASSKLLQPVDKFLMAYEELLNSDQLERARDCAYSLLADGGSQALNQARSLAEKAGHRKLADEVAALLRRAQEPEQVTLQVGSFTLQTAPRVVHRELAPLFSDDSMLQKENKAASPSGIPAAAAGRLPAPSQTGVTSVQPVPPESRPLIEAGQTSPIHASPQNTENSALLETGVKAANPFASSKRKLASAAPAPHFLRDALGASGARRTPSGENLAKSARS